MHEQLSLSALRAAADEVRELLTPTPQLRWPLLSRRAGAEVWVKHENHQPVGAFKIRGGITYINALRKRRPDVTGIISATRGNHGQSLAFAAKRAGLHPVIVVPQGNSRDKNAAMEALGAELIEYGSDFTEAAEHVATVAERRGLHVVPSFDADLVRGVASYWLELFDACPDLDAAYVPVGLGSGLCAGIAARDALGLSTQLIGVVSAEAPAYALSFAAGEPRTHPAETRIADGMAVRKPDPRALEMILSGTERIVRVSDDQVEDAMRAYFTDTHNLAEGAGAAPLAALLTEREQMRGKNVAVILCGANVDAEVFARVLTGAASSADPLPL